MNDVAADKKLLIESYETLGYHWGVLCAAIYRSLVENGVPEEGAIFIVSTALREYVLALMTPKQPTNLDSKNLVEYFLRNQGDNKPQ